MTNDKCTFEHYAMLKVIVVCVTIFLVCALLAACAPNEVESTAIEDAPPSMFVLVEHTAAWSVVYHRDTKVMYAVSDGSYNLGSFTLLVNADGTPMIYNG